MTYKLGCNCNTRYTYILKCTFTDSEDECDKCTSILEELENIDDDCERHGITFIKTQVINYKTLTVVLIYLLHY